MPQIHQSCAHSARKNDCLICHPHKDCGHGYLQRNCKQCYKPVRSFICPHKGGLPRNCAKCTGCRHYRKRAQCVSCATCIHEMLKVNCDECRTGRFQQTRPAFEQTMMSALKSIIPDGSTIHHQVQIPLNNASSENVYVVLSARIAIPGTKEFFVDFNRAPVYTMMAKYEEQDLTAQNRDRDIEDSLLQNGYLLFRIPKRYKGTAEHILENVMDLVRSNLSTPTVYFVNYHETYVYVDRASRRQKYAAWRGTKANVDENKRKEIETRTLLQAETVSST